MQQIEGEMEGPDWTVRGYALGQLSNNIGQNGGNQQSIAVRGYLEESLRCYRKAQEIEPEGFAVNTNVGTAFARLGLHDEAIKHWEKEVELYPGNAPSYVPLADIYWKRGKREDGLRMALRAAEIYSDAIAPWRTYGLMCKAAGQVNEAKGAVDRVKTLLLTMPKYHSAKYFLNEAIMYIQSGDFEAGLSFHELAMKHFQDNALVMYDLGVTLQNMEQFDLAIGQYTLAIQRDPLLTLAHFNRGLLLGRKGDLDGMRRDMKTTIATDPNHRASKAAATTLQMERSTSPAQMQELFKKMKLPIAQYVF
jgi:tetratricopeptide (TPR) repeat protein